MMSNKLKIGLISLMVFVIVFGLWFTLDKTPKIQPTENERYKECMPTNSSFVPIIYPVSGYFDENNNKVSDVLEEAIAKKDSVVGVVIMLKEPCTKNDLGNFDALGGNITHIYDSAFYGFSGEIPADKVLVLAKSLPSLYFMELDQKVVLN